MATESTSPLEERLHERLEKVLFSQEEIRDRVIQMGEAITREYSGEPLTVVMILQGGALFMADLIREIQLPLKADSVSVESYEGTESSGTVTFLQNRMPNLDGRHVILLDDILDTGRTLAAIRQKFEKECNPLSVKIAVLLSKKVDRAEFVEADYIGFEVGNEFVVGYGLDFNGEYRNLPLIGVLKPEYIR
ncbi:MAG: hypoxanthine phosphoribosyltransferase [Verrucomicrobiales bacterium]|nr:hypoxanthine phosphoribosyltransferase [Verrucomicrobiales bacterium]